MAIIIVYVIVRMIDNIDIAAETKNNKTKKKNYMKYVQFDIFLQSFGVCKLRKHHEKNILSTVVYRPE